MPTPRAHAEHWNLRLRRIARAIHDHQPLDNADILWLSRQRRAAAENRLPADRRQTLMDFNLHKRIDEIRFDELLEHVDSYIATHGHTNVPRRYHDPRDGYRTGQRVVEIRDRYHRDLLNARATHELEQRPQWTWRGHPDHNHNQT